MRLDDILPAFSDEIEKIAVSIGISHFPQTRVGRRSMRVATMLDRDKARLGEQSTKTDDDDKISQERYKERIPERPVEYEGGSGLEDGIGNYAGGGF